MWKRHYSVSKHSDYKKDKMKIKQNDLILELKKKSAIVRQHVVKMAAEGKTSHVGSALSCVDILVALYFKVLNIAPDNWKEPDCDRFILSKGHGSMAWYATLAERGFISIETLGEYSVDGGRLGEHPDCGNIPGILVTTGSLGHGLSVGLGMALAKKMDERHSNVYVLLSDGECNEGSVWESAMYAAHRKADNLIAIIDYNNMQAMGRSTEVNAIEPLVEKWRAFGWAVREIDGHNLNEITAILNQIPFEANKPSMIIAHTVLGKGVSFMEDDLLWHYQIPSPEQVKKALEELELP